jgi:hypothetical protein
MKALTKIQIILTTLVVVVFLVVMKMAAWLHSMAYADPVRQEWQPKLDRIASVLWFGTLIPWLLFTAYHVIIVSKRKLAA